MRPLPVPNLSRAILIGASRFTGLEQLPAVHNNLRDLKAALTDKDTGILPPDRVTVVDNPNSPAEVMQDLRQAILDAEDFLLVYYAGHGVRDQRRNERLYLAVRETDRDGPAGTAVSFEDVRDAIEDSRARTRVLILDCCYSGMAVGAMSGSVVDAQEVAVGGTAVMTSSPPNAISLAPPGERHTAFTGELITLLRNGSRLPLEELTVDVAFRALQRVLAERRLPAPKQKLTENASSILLSRAITRPPEPAILAPRLPASLVPALAPVVPVAQVPQTEPAAPAVPWMPIARLLSIRSLWLLLFGVFVLAAAYGIGGLVGAMADTSHDFGADLGTGIGGTVAALLVGVVLARRLRNMGDRTSLRQLHPAIGGILLTGWMVLAAVADAVCLLAVIALPFVPDTALATPKENETVSMLTGLVAAETSFVLVGLAAAYVIYRHWRPGAPPAEADGAPAEQH